LSIFGFIGRYKGHDLAIEALEQLPENYHLAIVGGMHPESSDDFLDQLLTSIPESLSKRVHITGWVDKETADHYFAATDVCLAPYRGDTLLSGSGAITWGISSGRPVIASKIEAFQSVDRLGNCLFLVAPEKTAELAWAVRKVIRDGSLRDRLVSNARRFADTYSWEHSIRSVSEIYASVLPERALRTGEDLSVFPGREAA
jgi:glycosyltransferase involved in cell wall biosynthesis